VYQPDPPGLIHDDPRLLPPWRGSSLLSGEFPPSAPTMTGAGRESFTDLTQAKNPRYLRDGDMIESSVATDDGSIRLGTQRNIVRYE
jgi:hypothetical protein